MRGLKALCVLCPPLLLLPLLLTACGSDEINTPDPVAIECVANTECGAGTCSAAGVCECWGGSCPGGSFCDEGVCKSQCTVGGNECGGALVCGNNGKCREIPDYEGEETCPAVPVDLDNRAPTVMLLIDRSGSMRQSDFGDNNDRRWDSMRDSLVGNGGAVTLTEASVPFGAAVYPGSGNGCPGLQGIDPALNARDDISSYLNDNGPNGSTPTGEAVRALADDFPDADGPRVIVLATDGEPDYCANPQANDPVGPNNQIDQVELEKARQISRDGVEYAYKAGIQTYVLGVAISNESLNHLDELARIGQGQDQNTGNAEAYSANSPKELADAFTQIIDRVRGCQFAIDGKVDTTQSNLGRVELNGNPLKYGQDWQLTNERTLELLGPSCDEFKNSDDAVLDAQFACGSVSPVL